MEEGGRGFSSIFVGPMTPSDLNLTPEINATHPDGFPGTDGVVVRAEEALIVVLVLVLWVAAIALFFNRWGKIRMLEPYQPKFQQQHRQSCSMVDPTPVPHRTCSKFNIHCLDHTMHPVGSVSGLSRPRQNSVFVGSSISSLPSQNLPRRAKSAFDIHSLILAECAVQRTVDGDFVKPLKDFGKPLVEFMKPVQRERGMSICHFDRTDVLARPLQRERGMSICHFDRKDVLARPLQRERGMSICHFDRTDVLVRPMQKERGMSICHFDRMDVLSKPLQRERGRSICHVDRTDIFTKPPQREKGMSSCHFDRQMPSCSKTPDVVCYKATCV